jgi:hypothetical protein
MKVFPKRIMPLKTFCFETKLKVFPQMSLIAILAIFQFWQNGTLKPWHGIQKIFLPKDFFKHYEYDISQKYP